MANEGKDTTEYAVTQAASRDWLSILVSVVGLLVGAATLVVDNISNGGILVVVAAAVVAFGNRFAKVLNAVGYGNTRRRTKEAEAAIEVAKIEATGGASTTQKGA